MPSGKKPIASLLRAFDEATFGPARTLNLRSSLPTVPEALRRADSWLRQQQVAGAREVLVITGRGNSSPEGISPVRTGVLNRIQLLRRNGVVSDWREHSPGSFVVSLSPMSALFDAPRRKRDKARSTMLPRRKADPSELSALQPETRALLRRLAARALQTLGVEPTEQFVASEMRKQFSLLAAAVGEGDREEELRRAALVALEELDG